MKTSQRTPTIIDVAHHAGVSVATVSRVINDANSVNADSRKSVVEAIRKLGYERNRSKYRPTGVDMLPILMPDIINPYFNQIAQGVQDAAEDKNLFPVIINITADPDHQRKIVNSLKKQSLNGMVICSADLVAEEWTAFCDETDIPLVLMHAHVDHLRIASILVDFETAASRVTQHLLDLKHSRFAYVAPNPESEHSRMRLRGIEGTLAKQELKIRNEHIVFTSPSEEGTFQAVNHLLGQSKSEPPTALIVYNDFLAIGALHALRTLGLRVPEDISVASFDDIPMAAHSNPPLTTVDVPKYRMGKLAVQLMMQLRENYPPASGMIMLDAPIIMRQSTGPAPDK